MRTLLQRTTRAVTLALSDAHLRNDVYKALHESPYPDHELSFRNLLAGRRGARLLDRASRALGVSHRRFVTALDSIFDLQFNMPVPAHFNTWKGGDNLIVATVLTEHDTVIGFDLDGNPVLRWPAFPLDRQS